MFVVFDGKCVVSGGVVERCIVMVERDVEFGEFGVFGVFE